MMDILVSIFGTPRGFETKCLLSIPRHSHYLFWIKGEFLYTKSLQYKSGSGNCYKY